MMRLARGYTLVEVLVALIVFSLLAASAYTALDALSRSASVHRERSQAFADLQLAVARLTGDLRQVVSRPVAAAAGRTEPALLGEPRRLAATRAGWSNPSGLPRSSLQRFAWRLRGSELQRIYWPVTDRVEATQAVTETVLADVTALSLRYRSPGGGWMQEWPAAEGAAASLPEAIEIVFDSRRFGRIRRVVSLR
jgi:general secretion pathway protein J